MVVMEIESAIKMVTMESAMETVTMEMVAMESTIEMVIAADMVVVDEMDDRAYDHCHHP